MWVRPHPISRPTTAPTTTIYQLRRMAVRYRWAFIGVLSFV
jgi:hypothetical protein